MNLYILYDEDINIDTENEKKLARFGFELIFKSLADGEKLFDEFLQANPTAIICYIPFNKQNYFEIIFETKKKYPLCELIIHCDSTKFAMKCFHSGINHFYKYSKKISIKWDLMKLIQLRYKLWMNLSTTSTTHIHRDRTLQSPIKLNDDESIVFNSEIIYKILRSLKSYSKNEHPLLLLGEPGVGKTLFARFIKYVNSDYQNFVFCNVATLPQDLFLSQLFGIERGAATGVLPREGLIQSAANGILFLDEIGEINPDIQASLLEVVQNRRFSKVGSSNEIRTTNARFIFSTNKNLKELINTGQFRRDLYDRITINEPITIPRLNDHKEDIPTLIHYFLEKELRKHTDIPAKHITINQLQFQKWIDNGCEGNHRGIQKLVASAISDYRQIHSLD